MFSLSLVSGGPFVRVSAFLKCRQEAAGDSSEMIWACSLSIFFLFSKGTNAVLHIQSLKKGKWG